MSVKVVHRRQILTWLCSQRSNRRQWALHPRYICHILSENCIENVMINASSSRWRGEIATFSTDVAAAVATSKEETRGHEEKGPGEKIMPLSTPKLQRLFDEIKELPPAEISALGSLVLQILGKEVFPGEFGGTAGLAAAGEGIEAVASEAEEATQAERTVFDLKLVGFDSKAKIKVIKEIRAIGGLGLKEAKELVESAPKIIQKDLKQDKADELKAQLEAVGAQVEIL